MKEKENQMKKHKTLKSVLFVALLTLIVLSLTGIINFDWNLILSGALFTLIMAGWAWLFGSLFKCLGLW